MILQNKTKRTLILIGLGIQFSIALLLSLVMTLINFGVSGPFLQNWARGFVVALLIIPVAVRVIPYVVKAVRAVLGNRPEFLLRSAAAVCVATLMEGVIALAVTLAQRGLSPEWPVIWGQTFLKAMPVGLLIGFTMTFLVQPRLQKLAAMAYASPARS